MRIYDEMIEIAEQAGISEFEAAERLTQCAFMYGAKTGNWSAFQEWRRLLAELKAELPAAQQFLQATLDS